MGEDVEPVGLAEAIAQIRAELVAAIQEGAGSRSSSDLGRLSLNFRSMSPVAKALVAASRSRLSPSALRDGAIGLTPTG